VLVVVPCRVPSKNDAGLKRFADMVTELCCLQVSVKTHIAPKGPLQFKRCQLMVCAPVCCLCYVSPLRGVLHLTAAALSVVAAEEITQPTTGAVLSGRKILLSGRLLNAARGLCTQSSCGTKGEPSGAIHPAGEPRTFPQL